MRYARPVGSPHAPLSRGIRGLLGAAAALVPGLAMWGFTVDDALIAVRYGESLASGHGWRFDPGGAPSDGVTPLPWAPILAVLARLPTPAGDPLVVLDRAKVLGLASWTLAAAALAVRASEPGPGAFRRARTWLALVVLALAFPVGAWAGSGMETGLATALATFAAVSFERPTRAALLAGAAAAFRPELFPWALTVSAGAGLASRRGGSRAAVVLPTALGAAPFVACVALRLVAFGRPVPLAVLAKPSDLEHGATYALAASLVMLLPILAFAPLSVVRGAPRGRALAVAFVVHVAAVALAGGDWMPFARLLVPVVPSLVLVVVDASPEDRLARLALLLRAAASLVLGVALTMRAAPAGRHVLRDRTALVHAARPVLVGARTVAALDVGWLSAAVPEATRIVDLAGLTDPEIAALSGGHTSKRVDLSMLEQRDVDTIVVYEPSRVVERRIVETPRFAERFTRVATLPLGQTGTQYGVYRRVPR